MRMSTDVMAGVLLGTVGLAFLVPSSVRAIQTQALQYDYWLQDQGSDHKGVVRLDYFEWEVEPEVEEVDDGQGGTTFVFTPGVPFATSAGFQTATAIDPEFLITTALPQMGNGLFQITVEGTRHTIFDWWTIGGEFAQAAYNPGNLFILRLLNPLPASIPVVPLPPSGFNAREQDVEVVSFGPIQLGQPGINGEEGDGDDDGEGGFAGGIRRSGFNRFDVRELNELLTAETMLVMDQDQWPPNIGDSFDQSPFGTDGFDSDRDLPVVLEATLDGNDAGGAAIVDGFLAGLANATYTIQTEETKQIPRTISLFTDLEIWSDDVAELLDRSAWSPDSTGLGIMMPASPEGWEKALNGFDIEFFRENGMILPDDMAELPSEAPPIMAPVPSSNAPSVPTMTSEQAAVATTLAHFLELQEQEPFGPEAQIGLPIGGTGMFLNGATFDYNSAGSGAIPPFDFSGVGDLGEVEFGLLIDFNRDGEIDGADIDVLYGHVGEQIGSTTAVLDAMFDLTLDTVVDRGDVDMLVHDVFGTDYGDLNLDGLINHLDKNTLEFNLDQPGGWAMGDVDGSGIVNTADLAILVSNVILLLGDGNNDGLVTGADLIAVQANFGAVSDADGLQLGDANDDGLVTGADLIAVQAGFGAVLSAGRGWSAPVPEPMTITVLALGMAICLRRYR